MQYFLVCNHPAGVERSGCFTFVVFWMSYFLLSSFALDWSVVCECGISWLYLITVKNLYNVTRYNRIFNIRHKIAGNGSGSIKIPSS